MNSHYIRVGGTIDSYLTILGFRESVDGPVIAGHQGRKSKF